jgi:hypothetical protein
MAKRFKASGILYADGEPIGLTRYRIAGDYLEELVNVSPKKIPVVSTTSKRYWNDPENLIGRAELEYVTGKGSPHITAHITFNEQYRSLYEGVLQSKERTRLRLGFLIDSFTTPNEDDRVIHDGKIRMIALSDTCLGGVIYKYGWEDNDEQT